MKSCRAFAGIKTGQCTCGVLATTPKAPAAGLKTDNGTEEYRARLYKGVATVCFEPAVDRLASSEV